MTLEFEAYIFDLDGTLVQTSPCYPYNITKKTRDRIVDALEANNVPHNIQEVEYDDAEEFWFCSVERNEFIKEKFKICPPVFWKEFNRLDKEYLEWCKTNSIPYVYVYSDVYVLKELQKQGAKLGVVTGCANYNIDYKLNEIKKESRFKFGSIIEANEGNGMTKPSPKGIEKCLEELGTLPEDACYIGDLAVDIQMAQAANVCDILINRNRAKIPHHLIPSKLLAYGLTELLEKKGALA